ncbi:hypothetical protein CCMA1212_009109 [Trichoderma ghanense]|uniref:Uncharacterized protein n=1 Tax=Trichoderma ghanense TaxID=65468 RepID=A0ABY2GV12_9HYPO
MVRAHLFTYEGGGNLRQNLAVQPCRYQELEKRRTSRPASRWRHCIYRQPSRRIHRDTRRYEWRDDIFGPSLQMRGIILLRLPPRSRSVP